MRLVITLDDLARMDGEGNDGRAPTALGCRYLHLIDEVAVSQMYPVEEADGSYRRGEGLRMCVSYYIHLFKYLAQIVANVIMMSMNAEF